MEKREVERNDGDPDYTEERSLINQSESLTVTIPSGFVKQHDLEKGQSVIVEKYRDRCVIRPE